MRHKIVLVLFLICFLGHGSAFGTSVPVQSSSSASPPRPITSIKPISALSTDAQASPLQPQPVDYAQCYKYFKIDYQKLFYLTLSAVNANRFKVDEIKSKSGYVLFSVSKAQYLAIVVKLDSQNSMLKIVPCNNVYFFPVGIVQNMFKYVELNINTPIERLSVL